MSSPTYSPKNANKKVFIATTIAITTFIGMTLGILAYANSTTSPQTISQQSGCAGVPTCADTEISLDELTTTTTGCAGVAACETTEVKTETTAADTTTGESWLFGDLLAKIEQQKLMMDELTKQRQAANPQPNPKQVIDNTTYFVGEYK